MTDWYRWDEDDLILRVRLQPGASRDGIAGLHGDRLRIRITAPPTDGKANAHLARFLAGLFGVPKSRVLLESGTGSREKRLRVQQPATLPPGVKRDL